MNDSREFQDVKKVCSSSLSHVPSKIVIVSSPCGMRSRDCCQRPDARDILSTSGNVVENPVMPAFGQNRIWQKIRIWPGRFRDRIGPELVFLMFWPCVCVSRFWVCSRSCVVLCCVVWCGVVWCGCCFTVSEWGFMCGCWFQGLVWTALRTVLPGTALPLDRPKLRSFFSLPPEISFFLLSLGVCSLNFGGV